MEKKFLEKYKMLDFLLKNYFKTDRGVSVYIEKLEKLQLSKYDLKLLKHLRWLRNKIVHDTDKTIINNDDIYDIDDFYNQIINQKDVLSRYYKQLKQKKQYSIKNNSSNLNKQESSLFWFMFIFLLIISIFMLSLIIFF